MYNSNQIIILKTNEMKWRDIIIFCKASQSLKLVTLIKVDIQDAPDNFICVDKEGYFIYFESLPLYIFKNKKIKR